MSSSWRHCIERRQAAVSRATGRATGWFEQAPAALADGNAGHTEPVTALLELGIDVEWTDGEAAATAREHAATGSGRLAELVEWLAGTQGVYPPSAPKRIRCLVLGKVDDTVADLAASLDVGLHAIDVPLAAPAAFAAGAAAADDEIESGTDLIVLAGVDSTAASALVVGTVTGAEPVALLPRGADAVDTQAWIGRAVQLRDARRRLASLRSRPDELLAALHSPVLAGAAAIAVRAASRRTPVILDGTTAVAAAVLCIDVQSRARRWWQVADTSADRVHTRAVEQLGQRPVLDLGTSTGNGIAGLLAVAVLRAAVTQAARVAPA
jgi:nicotinate-nucleotide--dimethylbenzimidazole phosphoribosyltransferase